MKTLYMLKGLPGSGKSHLAKQMIADDPNIKRVNKDDLRAMLDNSKWSNANEKFVLKIRDIIINEALQAGHHVIVDDTNLHPKHETQLRNLALSNDADFKAIFLDVPVNQCIKQDLQRLNSVGKDVIVKMYNDFIKPKPQAFVPDETLPQCIICDLDGTLALFGNKSAYERDFENDTINQPVLDILKKYTHLDILILSGRNDKFRGVTEDWIATHQIPYDMLLMRQDGDTRKDCIVKKEMFDKYIAGKYNPALILDDRNQVVELWRNMGLTCFQVAEGDF